MRAKVDEACDLGKNRATTLARTSPCASSITVQWEFQGVLRA